MGYKVDLKRYMADCETNYVCMLRLFPGIEGKTLRLLGLQHGGQQVVKISVLEQTPYTTLVTIELTKSQVPTHWLGLPGLRVRLYHDAKVAEVVECEGLRRPRPRCDYPNGRMFQRDEKAQWNRFLGEWLSQCIQFGYEAEPLYEPVVE